MDLVEEVLEVRSRTALWSAFPSAPWSVELSRPSDAVTAVGKSFGEVRPPATAKHSASTGSVSAVSSGDAVVSVEVDKVILPKRVSERISE